MRGAENPIKTPQAKARCGVSDRKIQAMQKIVRDKTVSTFWADSPTALKPSARGFGNPVAQHVAQTWPVCLALLAKFF